MKNVIVMLCLVALITGCSDGDDGIDPNADEFGKGVNGGNYLSEDGDYDTNGVFIWEKDKAQFTDYYSYIDTILSERVIERNVKYYSGENDNISVKWVSSGKIIETKESKAWREKEQKWIITNTATIDLSGLSDNVSIEAIVKLGGEKQSRRFYKMPIVITKNVSDAFGFTFGTKKDDMAMYIGYASNPSFIKNSQVSEVCPIEYFEFSNGVLSKLHSTSLESNYIPSCCEKCKIPNQPIWKDSSRMVENPQEWNNGHLKFKLYNTTFNTISGNESEHDYEIACLTIEKM